MRKTANGKIVRFIALLAPDFKTFSHYNWMLKRKSNLKRTTVPSDLAPTFVKCDARLATLAPIAIRSAYFLTLQQPFSLYTIGLCKLGYGIHCSQRS